MRSVPTTRGRTPKCAGSKSGAQVVPVRKSQGLTSPKNSPAGTSSETTIPIVVSTDMAAARNRTPWTRSSLQRTLPRQRDRACLPESRVL